MSVPATSPEKRRLSVMCNLEPTLHRIVSDLAARMDLSMSSYLRRLVIEDLREKGLLTDAILAKLFLSKP